MVNMFVIHHRIERAEENDNKAWYILMLVFAIVFYVGSAIALILLYVFFTEVSVRAVIVYMYRTPLHVCIFFVPECF